MRFSERDRVRVNMHPTGFMRLLKGIGLGLTCTRKGIYDISEMNRVRVSMHP